MFRLSAATMDGFRAGLRKRDFVEIQTPKIVGSSTESGANVFKLDYFGKPAYLAQSPQFYKQTMVGVFERVFEVGPVFRAEPHDTPRHLNEYVSLDAEMGFIEDHTTVMEMLTEVAGEMLAALEEESAALSLLGVNVPQVPASHPGHTLHRGKTSLHASHRRRHVKKSPTSLRQRSAGWASGRKASLGRISSS